MRIFIFFENWKIVYKNIGTAGGQIKLGHLKFNLCKSDH
jgi:hypothetical protein